MSWDPQEPKNGVSYFIEDWGDLQKYGPVHRITLTNDAAIKGAKSGGMSVSILTFGGIIQRLWVQDKEEKFTDVVLGCENLQGYVDRWEPYFGAIIGRYAGRIAGAKIEIGSKSFNLTRTEGDTTLHGGKRGWDKYVWDHSIKEHDDYIDLVLTKKFADGEEGFPGAVYARVVYRLERKAPRLSFLIDCKIAEDSLFPATVISVTNHTYWNLMGHGSGDIHGHVCQIHAEEYLESNEKNLPKGTKSPVEGTPFDFRAPKYLGEQIDSAHPQIKQGRGYDHTFWLGESKDLRKVAYLKCRESGICLTVHTTQPAAQMYTGNWISEIPCGYKDNAAYGARAGVAFETSNVPNAMHLDGFPSCLLKKGEKYSHMTTWDFTKFDFFGQLSDEKESQEEEQKKLTFSPSTKSEPDIIQHF